MSAESQASEDTEETKLNSETTASVGEFIDGSLPINSTSNTDVVGTMSRNNGTIANITENLQSPISFEAHGLAINDDVKDIKFDEANNASTNSSESNFVNTTTTNNTDCQDQPSRTDSIQIDKTSDGPTEQMNLNEVESADNNNVASSGHDDSPSNNHSDHADLNDTKEPVANVTSNGAAVMVPGPQTKSSNCSDVPGFVNEEAGSCDSNVGSVDFSEGFDELRRVFDAVDEEGTGTVKVSRLLQLAGLHVENTAQVSTS